ncbi:MAG: hypothetical protein ACKO34_01605, partial [Vampirovibrionales bacterium]
MLSLLFTCLTICLIAIIYEKATGYCEEQARLKQKKARAYWDNWRDEQRAKEALQQKAEAEQESLKQKQAQAYWDNWRAKRTTENKTESLSAFAQWERSIQTH